MQNPFQAAGNNVNDPLAFVKKLWGDMQLPGMVTPTLSVDELDKQIKDLKTVESWLNVNMSMLKGTIQALEVQRATISALKSMGESFAQATATSNPSASQEATASWPMHAASKSAKPTPREPTVEENEEEIEDEFEDEIADEQTPENQAEELGASAKPSSTSATQAVPSDQSTMQNPAAWWTVLQDQFKQALSHAMKDEKPDASPPVAAKSAMNASKASKMPVAKSPVKKAATASTTKARTVVAKPKTVKAPVVKVAPKAASKITAKSSTKSRA